MDKAKLEKEAKALKEVFSQVDSQRIALMTQRAEIDKQLAQIRDEQLLLRGEFRRVEKQIEEAK